MVDAGAAVTLIGSATDASDIVSVDWDFDYDGETFNADPFAAGYAMPVHTFTDVGTFWVAYRARANDGTESIDFAEITVNNTAPTGTVTLAATRPDGSPQRLEEGSEIFFAVAGLGDTDPDFPPLVWADWGDDGTFDLVDIDPATGLISHLYDDNGTFAATFRVADLQGLYAESGVSVAVANVGPSAKLVVAADKRNGRYEFDPGTPVPLRFTDVVDPSWEDTFAEYTYHYRVNGGEWYSAGASEFVPVDLYPGGSYTVEAYVADKDGGQSEYLTQDFLVLSDRVMRNSGGGRVEVTWTNPGGTIGSATLPADTTYRFDQQVSSFTVKLLDPSVTYNLVTNFGFEAIDGNNLPGVDLIAETDKTLGLPAFVGPGNIGRVTIGDSSTVSVSSRGDFGGLLGNPNSFAKLLAFRNQTGRILADRAGQIIASGTITQIDLNAGATLISANKYDPNGSIRTHNQPGREPAGGGEREAEIAPRRAAKEDSRRPQQARREGERRRLDENPRRVRRSDRQGDHFRGGWRNSPDLGEESEWYGGRRQSDQPRSEPHCEETRRQTPRLASGHGCATHDTPADDRRAGGAGKPSHCQRGKVAEGTGCVLQGPEEGRRTASEAGQGCAGRVERAAGKDRGVGAEDRRRVEEGDHGQGAESSDPSGVRLLGGLSGQR